MPGVGPLQRASRALKTGGPSAVVTAGIGVGATGVAGPDVETKTEPVAAAAANGIGADPRLGPVVLFGAAVLVLVVALFVPGLFDDRR